MSQMMTSESAPAEVEYETSGTRLPRRRSWPLALVGALAMVVSAVGFALVVLNGEERVPVLVAARDITAGEVLQLADTAEVLMVVDDRLGLIEADAASAAIGSALAVPVVAGTPLTEGMLSGSAWPESGRAVTTLLLAAGQFPMDAQPGWRVAVYVPLSGSGESEDAAAASGSAVWSFEAVVLSVTATGEDALFGVEFAEEDAASLALASLDGAVMVALGSNGSN
ncbi:SAF domain-containing protein [Glycomyces sp. L485]|uniref:SAF domain-containing protein n=1 Tax=Glycomyces sp. L485 TaxID=2909235 RepID=UPI001F4B1560|nr:SAF domain-containing protein [Glycomyces sp. L485]MCH7229925.1 SAF domain-containing protein [Glycomyces sp. L485]